WLMFDLAAKLIWQGGDDVYDGGKKDVARLYEYWVFFKLTDAIVEIFKINVSEISRLVEHTTDGLNLKLKQGKECVPLLSVFEHATRKFNVRFSYNRTFNGEQAYPNGGSWTNSFRPDFTLSIWPFGVTEAGAEREESILHIHFDAKYKQNLHEASVSDEHLITEEQKQNQSIYKNEDLLKMHAYRDAIRRTAGAYLLYPGDVVDKRMRYHEIIPGIGAFSIKPSVVNNGTKELKEFLSNIIDHCLNRASQRERMAYKEYDIHRYSNVNNLSVLLPEVHGSNRALIPDETFVLVGYYKNEQHLDWIIEKGLYNTRIDGELGSVNISHKETGAKYLLLYTGKEKRAHKIFKLKEQGPRIFSKKDLVNKQYPSRPSHTFYLVFEIEQTLEKEFENQIWNIGQLERFPTKRGMPFSVVLSELMRVLEKS
ncbi:MAG TPA: nuclease domain-containing protein, partial [Chitinophaga sp.]|uniref:nuclease domain-containing protein n=1 Tax=Chitinophaga sp. TaxID=1869181 RepID=UPI002DB7EF85